MKLHKQTLSNSTFYPNTFSDGSTEVTMWILKLSEIGLNTQLHPAPCCHEIMAQQSR